MKPCMRAAIFVTAVFVSALPNAAAIDSPVTSALPAMHSTLIERHPNFRCIVSLLERIVDDASGHGLQSLYIGPIEREGSGVFVRVYWPDGRAILLIDIQKTCSDDDMRIDDAALGWYRTKARIDLDTDVVPTAEDIGGSTYLVDRPWVDRVIAACRDGYLLIVEPSGRD